MVECEFATKNMACFGKLVLIDTWWNVNDDQILINQGAHVVLIDTWWNVNMYDLSNAYFTNPVLIDTWWNVNEKEQKSILEDYGF